MQKKKVKKKMKPKDKNRILIAKDTLEIKSSDPPTNVGDSMQIHKDVESDDIVVVDTFKAASELNDCDKLEFELGRLRSYLVSWITYMEFDGRLYKLMVDPMGKTIKVLDK